MDRWMDLINFGFTDILIETSVSQWLAISFFFFSPHVEPTTPTQEHCED